MTRQPNADSREVLPVALLAGGRPCLVVGGGKVGTHKARLLLAAQAQVRVVAPEVSPELAELVQAGTVQWEPRGFDDTDIAGMAVVFAATTDEALNGHIVELCRASHTLACAVDHHWVEGDFVTPATIREGGICLSITSGGKAYRRTRLLRETLGRHLALLQNADLLVLGTSHQELSLEEREPYHLVGDRLQTVGTMLRQVSGLHEFCLLSTCNRVELLAVASPETVACGILPNLLGFASLPLGSYYAKQGYDAFLHSVLVASGLLSQTPEKKHVSAQLKHALRTAAAAGWSGRLVDDWLDTTFHVANHVRRTAEARHVRAEIEDPKHWRNREEGGVAAAVARATAITAEHRSSYDQLLANLQDRDAGP